MQSDKLKNLLKVYYISLEECADRRKNLEEQFAEYGITPTAIVSKRWKDVDDELTGSQIFTLNGGTKGCLVSHLKMIRKWYEETNDEWGFFCEDDLSLDTVKYWNFTWEDLMKRIPSNAVCVQMQVIATKFDTFDFQIRKWDNWGATAYLLRRNYAKRLVETYCVSEKKFNVDTWHDYYNKTPILPLVENAIFSYRGEHLGEYYDSMPDVYSIPIFVEDVWKHPTTFPPIDEIGYDEKLLTYPTAQKAEHYNSSNAVLHYWRGVHAGSKGKNE